MKYSYQTCDEECFTLSLLYDAMLYSKLL